MSGTLTKILNVLLLVLLALAVLFGIMFYAGGITPETIGAKYEEPVYTQLLMSWGYILLFAAIALTVVFAVISMIVNPKGAFRTLIGLVFLGIIAAIAYGLAGDEILEFPNSVSFDITNKLSKNVGAGLIGTYILAFVTTIGIFATEIIARFK